MRLDDSRRSFGHPDELMFAMVKLSKRRPKRWRPIRLTSHVRVRRPEIEGRLKSLHDAARLKLAEPKQENRTDQIAHPAVGCPCPRQRVCVELLCELLLTLYHRNG